MSSHTRADGYPLVLGFKYLKWIPAFAGMTNTETQLLKSFNELSLLFVVYYILFWIKMI